MENSISFFPSHRVRLQQRRETIGDFFSSDHPFPARSGGVDRRSLLLPFSLFFFEGVRKNPLFFLRHCVPFFSIADQGLGREEDAGSLSFPLLSGTTRIEGVIARFSFPGMAFLPVHAEKKRTKPPPLPCVRAPAEKTSGLFFPSESPVFSPPLFFPPSPPPFRTGGQALSIRRTELEVMLALSGDSRK